MQGVVAGLLGCVFGTIGIFALGLLFVPLAALCAAVGLFRALSGRSMAGFGVSLLAGVVTVLAFITSPSLLLLSGGLAAAMALSGPAAPAGLRSADDRQSGLLQPACTPSPPTPVRTGSQASGAIRTGAYGPVAIARAEAEAGTVWCRNRRLSGELASYAASADCANPLVIFAYRRAGYRHMDLVMSLTAKRRKLAQAVDEGRLTEAQANAWLAQFAASLSNVEQQRDRDR